MGTVVHDSAVLEFLGEAREILTRVPQVLTELMKAPQADPARVSSIYRDMHTLKGNSQLFGYRAMGLAAHAMEASLDPVRKGRVPLSLRMLESALQCVDLLTDLLGNVEQTGQEQPLPSSMTAIVGALMESATAAVGQEWVPLRDVDFLTNDQGAMSLATEEPAREAVSGSAAIPVRASGLGPGVESIESVRDHVVDSTIRVQVRLLDRILDLMGELVLVRNQFVQSQARGEVRDLGVPTKILDVVTSELQSEVMKTRMQPIDSVVGQFHRWVRDASKELKKRIDLTIEGGDTELDKGLLEHVRDPLTHLVRNACDHGLESPEGRRNANKPETGHLLIRAFHEGGQIVIEVCDDGVGLNREKIVKKAIEKKLLSEDQAKILSDRQVYDLIFVPGFTTAETVSSVSGRGVGMDVVRVNIERLGGSVELQSSPGQGTTVRMSIPLTLAIIPALLIREGDLRFAIPQVKLVELVGLENSNGDAMASKIENLQGRPMIRLRGSLVPVLDLAEAMGLEGQRRLEPKTLAILQAGSERFALLIEQIMDSGDIVVKPLGTFLKHLMVFAGSTILGDGTIALILDIEGLAQRGHVLSRQDRKPEKEVFSKKTRTASNSDRQELLVVRVGHETRHAIPMCLIQRLEEFSSDAMEWTGNRRVIHYRNEILPLLDVNEALKYSDGKTPKLPSRQPVVVVQKGGRSFGLLVDAIEDLIDFEGVIDDSIRDREGILGNALHREQLLVVIDALTLIDRWIDPNGKVSSKTSDAMAELKRRKHSMTQKRIRVLYAEDVAFFRRHVSKVLNSAGIDVTTVEDGKLALEELEAADDQKYNLLLSDIEMPNMTGLELAREVRARERYKKLPMIALTTRCRESDIKFGKEAGFNAYLEKLNPDVLLAAIQELFPDAAPRSLERTA